jgi:uncharacterized membrane protein
MTGDNAVHHEPAIFSATLTPHRSLGPTGFLILMTCLGGASFATGVVFIILGAWPVFGFLGLDVLLVYLAFRANYRAAKSYEQVIVTPSTLTVRKITPRGRVREEWTANPLWVRLQQDVHEEFGVERLLLISRGRRVVVAGDLGPDEKQSFAKALSQALFEARRGPTLNP